MASAYEEERLANIRRNQELLRELEISEGLGLEPKKQGNGKIAATKRKRTSASAQDGEEYNAANDSGENVSDSEGDEAESSGAAAKRAAKAKQLAQKRAKAKRSEAASVPTRRSARTRSSASTGRAVDDLLVSDAAKADAKAEAEASAPGKPVYRLKKVRLPTSGEGDDAVSGAHPPDDGADTDEGEEANADERFTAPLPKREGKSTAAGGRAPLKFERGYWHFTPNLTPAEMLAGGAFGGTALRPHYSTVLRRQLDPAQELADAPGGLPPAARNGRFLETERPNWRSESSWQKMFLTSSTYRPEINRFGVKASQSLEEWEKAGWIRRQDPRGWWQWYLRFYYGRRTKDDERQIQRWQKACGPNGRFKRSLAGKIAAGNGVWDDESIAPIIRQTCWHWAVEMTKADYERYF